MFSWRLWLSISRPDSSDPIFKRFSQRSATKALPSLVGGNRRYWLAGGFCLLIASIAHPPLLLMLLLGAPILLITALVATPLLLPIIILFAGAWLVAAVIAAIEREKRQRTYDLLCASPGGALRSNWSCAVGILHRDGAFATLRWGTRLSLWLGLALLGALILMSLGLFAFDPGSLGAPQLRLLLWALALLAAIHSNMTQSLALSMITGLLAGSFAGVKRDASLLGLLIYGLAQGLPLALAGLFYALGMRLAGEEALLRLGIELGALALVALLRELAVAGLWRGLAWRLGEPGDSVATRLGGRRVR